jgi:hypothetical protein
VLTALVIDESPVARRQVTGLLELAVAAEALGGRSDLAGLVQAADAAAGRLAARRRGIAA